MPEAPAPASLPVPEAPTREGRVATPVAGSPALDAAEATLLRVVEAHTTDPQNPWAIGHGMLVLGPRFPLLNGAEASAHLFSRFADVVTSGGADVVAFPATEGEIRIEPHQDLLLKSMAASGLDPGFAVEVDGTPHIAGDLWRGSLAQTRLGPPASYETPNDLPWTLQGLATWAPEADLRWTAADGSPQDLDLLTHAAVDALTRETAFLAEALRQGKPFEKRGQGIFAYTCGGAHLLQGAAYAVARGFGTPEDRAAVQAQVELMFFRLPVEMRIVDQAIQAMPEHRLRLFVQKLKFAGHFLESMSLLEAVGLYTPTAAQEKALEAVATDVERTVKILQDAGAFDKMAAIRTEDEQLYLDLVGDSAHALRGLRLARGTAGVLY